jgi:uncharacterized protein (DUF362 family)
LAPVISACASEDVPETEEIPAAPSADSQEVAQMVTPSNEPPATPEPIPTETAQPVEDHDEDTSKAKVALVRTGDRAEGVARAMALLETDSIFGKQVLLKPNFNSADPAPGSTHPDVLRALVTTLNQTGAGRITVADRSGMGSSRDVMEKLGVISMAEELAFDIMVFDELTADDWVVCQENGFHWSAGFAVPRQLLEAECVVQTCNLKTHRFGGHFTLSLKNSVGFAARIVGAGGHNYMSELHNSPFQRLMIAEINTVYSPDLIVMDGVEAFVDGGPDKGKKVASEVVLAGTDRVAIDAVGVAILRHFGTTQEVSQGSIFELEQIARAAELGLGVDSPDKIELITGDGESRSFADQIGGLLQA